MTLFVPYHTENPALVRLRTCPACGRDSDISTCSYVWNVGTPMVDREWIVIWCACGAVMYAKGAPLGVKNPGPATKTIITRAFDRV